MLEFINQELEALRKSGLYRTTRTIEKIKGSKVVINGKELTLFCSNNYLGLAQHPKVVEAAVNAIKEYGSGSGASRLISGNFTLHDELEKKIASFKGREDALVFSTGYMANLGAITTLVNEQDVVIIDRLNHASIIDACRLSGAVLRIYPHKDMQFLKKILMSSGGYRRRLIVTDAVFSMDGDITPLPQIVGLAREFGAITMVDEAHATGVVGETGRGVEEHFGIFGQIDIIMGTLSKAIGSIGGFVAGSHTLVDFLRNRARSFIYTTALPPAACAAAIAAIQIMEDGSPLPKLISNTAHLRAGIKELNLNMLDSETQIIPIFIGDLERTMEVSSKLSERGIFISGIRPPTVLKNKCRLRITATADHSKEELECLVSLLRELIPA